MEGAQAEYGEEAPLPFAPTLSSPLWEQRAASIFSSAMRVHMESAERAAEPRTLDATKLERRERSYKHAFLVK